MSRNDENPYAERDIMALDRNGGHYFRHVSAMTRYKLHHKSDIAAELAWRDARIAELEAALAALGGEQGPISAVMAEVERSTRKFPTWPTDPLHAAAVLGEEFGELTKAVLQSVYEPHKSTPEDVATEAIQTAAMAVRFLMSLDVYLYERSVQHSQTPPPPGGKVGG